MHSVILKDKNQKICGRNKFNLISVKSYSIEVLHNIVNALSLRLLLICS